MTWETVLSVMAFVTTGFILGVFYTSICASKSKEEAVNEAYILGYEMGKKNKKE